MASCFLYLYVGQNKFIAKWGMYNATIKNRHASGCQIFGEKTFGARTFGDFWSQTFGDLTIGEHKQ